jgi:adenylate cyclase
VVETLNRIFRALSHVVFAHRGTFDKYLGDGLMAFYGAPVAGDDDARRAVETAVEMQQRFRELRAEAGPVMHGLGLGVGVHSGEAIVGNIGSDRVMDYTVIGDTVNVAKRLQERAEAGETLVSAATARLVPGLAGRRLDPLTLPGRSEPVVAYVL